MQPLWSETKKKTNGLIAKANYALLIVHNNIFKSYQLHSGVKPIVLYKEVTFLTIALAFSLKIVSYKQSQIGHAKFLPTFLEDFFLSL